MTDAELSELESLARAATPGPWKDSFDDVLVHKHKILCECRTLRIKSIDLDIDGYNNAAYIAAANPDTILKLIAEIRELKSRYPHPQYSYEL